MRVYTGAPFAWRRHLDRLAASADGLGLPVPVRDELRAPRPTRCSSPTGSSTGGCVSRSRAGPHHSGSDHGAAPPTVMLAATGMAPGRRPGAVVVVPGPVTSTARPRGSRPSPTPTTSVRWPSPHEHRARPRPSSATHGVSCVRPRAPTSSSSRVGSYAPRSRLGLPARVPHALVLELSRTTPSHTPRPPSPLDALAGAATRRSSPRPPARCRRRTRRRSRSARRRRRAGYRPHLAPRSRNSSPSTSIRDAGPGRADRAREAQGPRAGNRARSGRPEVGTGSR